MSEDTDNNEYKRSSALVAVTITTLGTMAGTTIDVSGLTKCGMAIGNWAVTTCTGILSESVNVATQQHLQQIYEPVTNTNHNASNKTTTLYGGGGPRNYVCALY